MIKRLVGRRYSILPIVLIIAALAAVACSSGDDEDSQASNGVTRLKVATTVSPITSLVENIGGDKIELTGIVPEGTNSHTFEPKPSVARTLSDVDLFVLNGLFLEEPSLELAEATLKDGAVILSLGEKTIARDEWAFDFSFPQSDDRPNPHLWTNPAHALKFAELIRDELSRLDPINASYYGENFEKLKVRIDVLDQAIFAAVETIPEGNRRLLTYHDSFPYFAQRYGFEVIGAVQPSDFTEPSAQEVVRLIKQIRETGVPAIFGSEVFPSPVMEQIAKEGGAQFIDQLRDDDLPGKPGDPRHSYLGLMLTDMEIMIGGLGGSLDALSVVDPSLVFDGLSGAKYPQ